MPHTEEPAAFLGYWKITHMETWAQHYVDLVVPGFIEFTYEDDLLMGRFQFGTVSGWLDCRLRDLEGATVSSGRGKGTATRTPAAVGDGRDWSTVSWSGTSSFIALMIQRLERGDSLDRPGVRTRIVPSLGRADDHAARS